MREENVLSRFIGLSLALQILCLFSSLFATNEVHAAYSWSEAAGYYSSPYLMSRPKTQIISLDLDPQNILNSSFRIAARENRVSDLTKLLNQGAEINSQTSYGETALMLASRRCYPQVVEALLENQVDVNIENQDGKTALILAAQDSCEKVIRILVKHPDVVLQARDRLKKTALDYALDNSIAEVDGASQGIIRILRKALRRKG